MRNGSLLVQFMFASPGEPMRHPTSSVCASPRPSTYIMDPPPRRRQSSRQKRCVPSGYGGFSSAQIRLSAIDMLSLHLACMRSAFIAQAPATTRQASGELDHAVLGTCRIGLLERPAVIWRYLITVAQVRWAIACLSPATREMARVGCAVMLGLTYITDMRKSTGVVALSAFAGAAPHQPYRGSSSAAHPGGSTPAVYTPNSPADLHNNSDPSKRPGSLWPTPIPQTTSYTNQSAAATTTGPVVTTTCISASPSSATSLGACGTISKLAASSTRAEPGATPIVPAQLAYECINSVPFNQSAASQPPQMREKRLTVYPKRAAANDHTVDLLDSIRPYLNWQTTIEYLKDPPAEYTELVQAPYDFYARYEETYSKAKSGSYPNEYAFGWDLYEVFQRAHDGHFVIDPDSVTLIFSYGRTAPLVSVSDDGDVPQVFVYADVLAAFYGNASFVPSPLCEIDGHDSTEWLLDFAEYGSLQDRDALWNNMFYNLAQVSLGSQGTGLGTFAGGGRGRWVYPGPHTTLTFVNGSSIRLDNYARVLVPFDNITSGEDIYHTYFAVPAGKGEPAAVLATQSPSSSTVPSSTAATATSTSIPAPGYPSPLVRETNNLNSGYFLEGGDYDDVAVLSIASFVGFPIDEGPFQAVNTYTINRAVAANKTKLIIDVSANGGGTILQGYDVFKQLFPQLLPYGATRFRAHEAFDLIGQEISYFSGLAPRSLSTNQSTQNAVASPFNYRSDADVDYEPFTSWPEKYGPHAYGPRPDNFTSIVRWNLSDVLIPDNSGGIYVSGYLNRSNITTPPFAAEDIIIVYDGYCASTCTIFSELMRQQAGVKTVALGGRPSTGIIQAVGGVKGTNDYTYQYILGSVEAPFASQGLHNASYYASTALGDYTSLPLWRTTDAVVNARDGIRHGDPSQTPLQFVYEPADCRIYYTPEMAVDQSAVWRAVADAAWGGINHCVAGSLPGSNRTSYDARQSSRWLRQRREVDISAHLESFDSVWTGKHGVKVRRDGMMIL
ncbi:Peptidase family S41 [Teratosphaeria destructans]|uniref:Peptidase family S41 n=1 Tax=Teratosphaeria destructans TaxID=418781 RepID=A0A9W7SJ55_9PEZI|nr:Peptidase family S41 [Teratosphaeria destructans]